MGRHNISFAYAATVGGAMFLFGCSMSEVASVGTEDNAMTTAQFNELAKGKEGQILLLEETSPSNATQIEATADSLFWKDGAGQSKRSPLVDVQHVQFENNSSGLWFGAKWGAMIGAVGGLGIAGLVTSNSESEEQRTMAPLAYVFFPAVLGVVGGVTGGVYGLVAGYTVNCTFRH